MSNPNQSDSRNTYNDLNLVALSKLFKHRTTSYKYLLFLAILHKLKSSGFASSYSVEFRELVVEMLVIAWYPANVHYLSFGTQDKIVRTLEDLNLEAGESSSNDMNQIRQEITHQDINEIVKYLKRYVPFRLILPFFKEELQGVDINHAVDTEIPKLAVAKFNEIKPLYCFDRPSKSKFERLIFHPEWVKYIEVNYGILLNWVSWEWLQYMQDCNPSVEVTHRKLFV
ncbi:MAG: hypothetical protein JJU32_16725 [Phormidium sp. BM_Day4_Bin.17]|nr:hypothetical protein [Phormidium sp. BM_Day4_Bin.17]UCJ13251.1 MAG: hypothetical protein JWS08_05590 [Phormidium sp. PBR-2020]